MTNIEGKISFEGEIFTEENGTSDNGDDNGGTQPENLSYVDVMDFGAVGDETTDDYQAIMDAIDYACDNYIKTVYLPRRTFGVGSKLFLNDSKYSNLNVISDGGTLKALSIEEPRMFEIKCPSGTTMENMRFRGFDIDGNYDNLTGDNYRGIYIWNDGGTIQNIKVSDINIYEIRGSGIDIDGVTDLIVDNCMVSGALWHGFVSGINNNRRIILTNITAQDTGRAGGFCGIDLRGGECTLSNFHVTNSNFGMKTSTGEPKINLNNGFVSNCAEQGYRILQNSEAYLDNLISCNNGGSGFEFRHGGKIHAGTLVSDSDQRLSVTPANGVVYVEDTDFDEFTIDHLIIRDPQGDGIGFRFYSDGIKINHLEEYGVKANYFYKDNNYIGGGVVNCTSTYWLTFHGNHTTIRDLDIDSPDNIYSTGSNIRMFNCDFRDMDGTLVGGDGLTGDYYLIRDCIAQDDKEPS